MRRCLLIKERFSGDLIIKFAVGSLLSTWKGGVGGGGEHHTYATLGGPQVYRSIEKSNVIPRSISNVELQCAVLAQMSENYRFFS